MATSMKLPQSTSRVLAPRARDVTVFAVAGGAVQAVQLSTNGGFLVFDLATALNCEVEGVEYLYINPAAVVAVNVQDPTTAPLEPLELLPANGAVHDEHTPDGSDGGG